MKGERLTEAEAATIEALTRASDCSLQYAPCFGGWVYGPNIPCPASMRTPSKLLKFADRGLIEHDVRAGHRIGAKHHYWRPTPAGRAVLATQGGGNA